MNDRSNGTATKSSVLEELIRSRRSIRAFQKTSVAKGVIDDILSLASLAPSNSNTQPWMVQVLVNDEKRRLTEALLRSHEVDRSFPSRHFPDPLPEANRRRQLDFGARFYETQDIGREDVSAVNSQLARNYDFYGAPVGLIFTIDSTLRKHSWLDCGLFLQNVMLAARSRGLDTCAQVVFAHHEATIAEVLRLPSEQAVICGMSLGYADPDAIVNHIDFPREPVGRFCIYRGFDPEP